MSLSYESWIHNLMERIVELVGLGAAQSALAECEASLKQEFGKGDLESAGIIFLKKLVTHDLDLQIGKRRGEGSSESQLAYEFGVSKEEARKAWSRGFKKQALVLAWFRGQDIDFSASFDFRS
ncbi:hypothetical protein [Stenotrophomonas sp. OVS01A]|uniref:hypothetical protein n=1 Tax=Stenotrophomonas sp. OVS01A TaxID=2862680 RepID=UPI001CBFCF97|nr:hypothetical protein [Stenotrophomonas sp. OVS01A]